MGQPNYEDLMRFNLDKQLKGMHSQMDYQTQLLQRLKDREQQHGKNNKVRFVVIEEEKQEN